MGGQFHVPAALDLRKCPPEAIVEVGWMLFETGKFRVSNLGLAARNHSAILIELFRSCLRAMSMKKFYVSMQEGSA
jgi:hypothetical protein